MYRSVAIFRQLVVPINSRCFSITPNFQSDSTKLHSGKVALVTASTEGIGFHIAKKLAEDGASVVISSRKQKNVDNALKELTSEGLDVIGKTCHVNKSDDRKSLIEFALEKKGGIDYFISNAGTNPVPSLVLDTEEQVWDKVFETNVKSTFMFTKEIVPHLSARGGSIVYVSSVAGYNAAPMLGAYSVSKTALFGLTRAVSEQCAPLKIRVNCIAPGLIKTKFSSMLLDPKFEEMATSNIALKRAGEPHECSGLVSFLCSDLASYITGETITISGGMFSRL